MASARRTQKVEGLLLTVAAVMAAAPAGAVALGPSVDLVLTYGHLETIAEAENSVGPDRTEVRRDVPSAAFLLSDSESTMRQSASFPEPSYALASASSTIEAGTSHDPGTGDVLLFGRIGGTVEAESVPFCDEFGCAYADYSLGSITSRYGVWFDLLQPMFYGLRVELQPGPVDNAEDYFEFNSLVGDDTLFRTASGDANGGLLVFEQTGQLSDGYHELLSEVAEYVSVPGQEGELHLTSGGSIRYWLTLNATAEPAVVPLPGTLVLVLSALASLRFVRRQALR